MKKKLNSKESSGRRRGIGATMKKPKKSQRADGKGYAKQEIRTAGVLKSGQEVKIRGRKRGRHNHAEVFLKKVMPKLMAVVNSSPIPQFALDHDHRILYWNKALEAISGIKAEDVIGTKQQWRAFYDKRRPTMADLLIEGDVKGILYWYGEKCNKSKYVADAYEGTDYFPELGKKGIWLFFTAALIKDTEGNVIGAVETLEDITDRKLAELKLRESEERFRQIAESTEEWIWEINSKGLYTYSNSVVKEILGYEPDEIVGKKYFYDFFPPDSRKETKKAAFEYFTMKEAFKKYVNVNLHKNGSMVLLETSGIPVLNSKGELRGYRGADTDITERKRNEVALRESEERWQFALEGSGDGVWDWNAQTNKVYFSHQWKAMLGYEDHEISGSLDEWDSRIHPDDRKNTYTELNKHLDGKTPFYMSEHRLRCKNGEYKWILDRGKIITRAPDGKPLRIIGTHSDITERKKAENALRESEDRFKTIATNLPGAVYQFYARDNGEMGLYYADDRAFEIFGIKNTPIETFFERYVANVHPDDRESFMNSIRDGVRNVSDWDWEGRYINPRGFEMWTRGISKPTRRGTELIYNGFMLDITDRKLAELKLRESEERFRQLVENAGEVILVAQGDMLKYANPMTTKVTSFSQKELYARPFLEFVHPEDRVLVAERYQRRISGGDAPAIYQFRLINKDGSIRWVEINGVRITWNKAPATLNFIQDVTARKQAEEALRQEKIFTDAIFESVPGLLYLYDEDGLLRRWNKNHETLTGYTPEELYGKHVLEWFKHDEKDAAAIKAGVEQSFHKGHASTEAKLMTKRGEKVPYYFTATLLEIQGRKYFTGIGIDISKRKQAEDAIKESEEKYRTLVDNMYDVVYRCDLDGNLIFTNPSAARILGFSSVEEMIGLKIMDFQYYPEELKKQYEILKREGKLMHYKSELKRHDTGEPITVLSNSQFYCDKDGNILGIEGVYSDITDLMRVEKALSESESKYRELVENANSIILRMDTQGVVTFFNEFAQSFFGYTSEEILGKNVVGTIVPETDSSGQDMGSFIRDIAKDPEKYKNNENENIKKSGDRVWISWTNKIIQDKQGKVKEILCIGNDITAHKKSEDALRQSEIKFRELADFLPEIVFEMDVQGNLRYLNRVAFTLLGYSPDDLARGLSIFDGLRPEDRDRARNNLNNILKGKIAGGNEYLMLKKDKSTIPVIIHSRAIKPDGGITGIRGIIVDISERKIAENALRESEEKFRRLFEDSGVAQFLLDGSRIIDCNNEAVDMMGCGDKSQIRQKLFYDFSPEVQQDGESSKEKGEKYIRLAIQKRSVTFEWQYRRLDGEILTAEVVVTAVPMGGKDILHVNVKDITERKRLQNEIINIIDIEQQRLGQNLHDGLGQDLTGVAFMCNTLTKKLKESGLPEAAMSEEITSLVYHIITRVRMLSRELYPPNLVENEITYTLQQFAANISAMFDISCTFAQDPDLVISDIFISTQIYYIVREAVNNSIKHGQAQNIIISLTHNKNDAILVVEDDGIGRPESMDKYKGLGLRIMAYRMGTIHGTFSIFDNYKSRGVIIFCTFPIYKLHRDH